MCSKSYSVSLKSSKFWMENPHVQLEPPSYHHTNKENPKHPHEKCLFQLDDSKSLHEKY